MRKGISYLAAAIFMTAATMTTGAAYAPGGPVLLRDGFAGADNVPLNNLFSNAYSTPGRSASPARHHDRAIDLGQPG